MDYQYTDFNGTVHHETWGNWGGDGGGGRARTAPDPWVPVRRLMTCPHCGIIGPHREQGDDPQKEYVRLAQKFNGPMQCGSCHAWSITAQVLEIPQRGWFGRTKIKQHPQGLRVNCPPDRIPERDNAPDREEER